MQRCVPFSALLMIVATLTLASTARADLTAFFTSDTAPVALAVVSEPLRAREEPVPHARAVVPVEEIAPLEVRFVRIGDGRGESATLVLRDESGVPAADTLVRLSVLARPRGVDAPASLDGDDEDFVAPEIRRLHAGLLPLLTRLADHFAGHAIEIVSGYRPNAREGSRHRFGRALDLRVADIGVDEVRAFLDGEPSTGVGLYPTSGFVHLDVRSDTVRWVDDSGPGQAPHVVRSEVVAHAEAVASAPGDVESVAAPTAAIDVEAIAQAMLAADAITLDLGLPP